MAANAVRSDSGYNAKEVARLLDMSVGQVRGYARAGFLEVARGSRGEYRFQFQDLVLLRTARGLEAAAVSPTRIKRALRRLKQELPGRPLSAVSIDVAGDRLVVRDDGRVWNPDSGQSEFDFGEARRRRASALPQSESKDAADQRLTVDDWFRLGNDLEMSAPDQARESYRRALELDPKHLGARINLGRLLHEANELHAAESNYRFALAEQPGDATAWFNLGVVLEDLERQSEAIKAYLRTIEIDAECADAYFNLAGLYEAEGDAPTALRYLKRYRSLTEEDT